MFEVVLSIAVGFVVLCLGAVLFAIAVQILRGRL